MATVTVDMQKCIGCKKCAIICPISVFDFENKLPHPRRLCMGCSYCETECPVSAITVDRLKALCNADLGDKIDISKVNIDNRRSESLPFQSIYQESRKI